MPVLYGIYRTFLDSEYIIIGIDFENQWFSYRWIESGNGLPYFTDEVRQVPFEAIAGDVLVRRASDLFIALL